MATIVNNPGTGQIERTDDSAGWAVSVAILVAILVIGSFFFMRYYNAPGAAAPANDGGTNINVTLPESTTGGGTQTGGTQNGSGTNTGGGSNTGGSQPQDGTVIQ